MRASRSPIPQDRPRDPAYRPASPSPNPWAGAPRWAVELAWELYYVREVVDRILALVRPKLEIVARLDEDVITNQPAPKE